jgi:hypothetical protein
VALTIAGAWYITLLLLYYHSKLLLQKKQTFITKKTAKLSQIELSKLMTTMQPHLFDSGDLLYKDEKVTFRIILIEKGSASLHAPLDMMFEGGDGAGMVYFLCIYISPHSPCCDIQFHLILVDKAFGIVRPASKPIATQPSNSVSEAVVTEIPTIVGPTGLEVRASSSELVGNLHVAVLYLFFCFCLMIESKFVISDWWQANAQGRRTRWRVYIGAGSVAV